MDISITPWAGILSHSPLNTILLRLYHPYLPKCQQSWCGSCKCALHMVTMPYIDPLKLFLHSKQLLPDLCDMCSGIFCVEYRDGTEKLSPRHTELLWLCQRHSYVWVSVSSWDQALIGLVLQPTIFIQSSAIALVSVIQIHVSMLLSHPGNLTKSNSDDLQSSPVSTPELHSNKSLYQESDIPLNH